MEEDLTGRPRSAYRFVVLGMLLLVYIISYIDRQIIGILSVPMKAELKLTDSQLGIMGGLAFAVFYTGLGIPIARLADRMNRTYIMAASLALWSLFTALCGMAGNFAQLLFMRVGVGVGEAGGVAPAYSLLSDYFPPNERGRVLGFYSLGVPLGSAAGLLIGGYVGAHYGWRYAFIALGVVGVLLTPVFLLVVREATRGSFDEHHDQASKATFLEVLAHLRRLPVFWVLSGGTGFGAMMSYGLAFWLPSYVQRSHGLSLSTTSQLLGAVALFGGCASMFGSGWLADRFGARDRKYYALIPAYSLLLTLFMLILALQVSGIVALFFCLLGVQLFSQGYAPPTIALVQSLAPAHMRATVSAIFLLILNLMGLGLGTVIFGVVSDYFTVSFGKEGLSYSVLVCGITFYSLSAILFFLGSRLLPSKLAGVVPSDR